VDIIRHTAGRGGKTVTVAKGFIGIGLPEKEQLARAMQKACGTGGTVKNGQIEIQGDKRAEVARILSEAKLSTGIRGRLGPVAFTFLPSRQSPGRLPIPSNGYRRNWSAGQGPGRHHGSSLALRLPWLSPWNHRDRHVRYEPSRHWPARPGQPRRFGHDTFIPPPDTDKRQSPLGTA